MTLKEKCESFCKILENSLRIYFEDHELRRRFSELKAVERLVNIKPTYHNWIQLARFDVIKSKEGAFKLLETNCDCPGGVASVSPMKNAYLDALADCLNYDFSNTIPQEIDNQFCFIEHILNLYKEVQNKKPNSIGYIYSLHQPLKMDLENLSNLTREIGLNASVEAVQRLEFSNDHVYIGGERLDLAYLKIDAYIQDNGQMHYCLYKEDVSEIEPLLKAIEKNNIITINSFPSIMIAENKKLLSLIQSNYYSKYLNPAEKDIIDNFCLPTFTLSEASESELISLKYEKNNFVLKSPLDTQGRGIFIGKRLIIEEWLKNVEIGLKNSYVAQKFVEQDEEEVFSAENFPELKNMTTVLSVYIYGGKVVGMVARSSPDSIINVNRNGVVRNVFVAR